MTGTSSTTESPAPPHAASGGSAALPVPDPRSSGGPAAASPPAGVIVNPYGELVEQALADICVFANEEWEPQLREADIAIDTRAADLPVFSIRYAVLIHDVPPDAVSRALWLNFVDAATAQRVNPDMVQSCDTLETVAPDRTVIVRRTEMYQFPQTPCEYVYVVHQEGPLTLSAASRLSRNTVVPPPTCFDSSLPSHYPALAAAAGASPAADGSSLPAVAPTMEPLYIGVVRSTTHPHAPSQPLAVRAEKYEGWIVRPLALVDGVPTGSVLLCLGQTDAKHGAPHIPAAVLDAVFAAVPRYVRNSIAVARDLHFRGPRSGPPAAAASSGDGTRGDAGTRGGGGGGGGGGASA